MSHIIDKLRSKAYYAYEGFLDETINKATKFLASSTTKFITSTFTIELNYDLEDLSSDTVLYPLKIIEKHFGNKKLTKNSYTDYYGERHLRPGTTYTEYFPNIRSFMTVHYPNREENSDNSISIFLWGKNPAQLEEFFKKLYNHLDVDTTEESVTNKIVVCFYRPGSDYFSSGKSIPVKNWDKIFVEDNVHYAIMNYISSFKKAEILFNKIEVTYKLGILLYGPPGTGKTSIAKAIARYLSGILYIVNMAYFSPEAVEAIKNKCESRDSLTVFLLEDIDYIFGKRQDDRTEKEKQNGNALLQLLDGADSSSKAVFIATTNDIDSLDPAITRDGRFDLKIHMDNISTPLAETMVKSIGIESDAAIHEILDYSQEKHNPAQVQNKTVQYIFNHIEDLNSFVNADHLIDDLEEDEDED